MVMIDSEELPDAHHPHSVDRVMPTTLDEAQAALRVAWHLIDETNVALDNEDFDSGDLIEAAKVMRTSLRMRDARVDTLEAGVEERARQEDRLAFRRYVLALLRAGKSAKTAATYAGIFVRAEREQLKEEGK